MNPKASGYLLRNQKKEPATRSLGHEHGQVHRDESPMRNNGNSKLGARIWMGREQIEQACCLIRANRFRDFCRSGCGPSKYFNYSVANPLIKIPLGIESQDEAHM